MKTLIWYFIKADFREKYLLFWDWLFPPLLMLGMALFVRESEYATFLLPGLLTFMLFQTLIYAVPFRMAQFRENGIFRLLSEENAVKTFASSFIVSKIILAVTQSIVLLPIGCLILKPSLSINLGMLFIAIATGLFAIGAMSLFVGAIAKKVNSALGFAQLFYIGLSAISGIFYPLEKSPQFLRVIAVVSPIKYLHEMLKYSLEHAGNFPLLALIVLILFGLFFALLAVVIMRNEFKLYK